MNEAVRVAAAIIRKRYFSWAGDWAAVIEAEIVAIILGALGRFRK